jgi:NADH:ubiquinone oxidoreductase subunit K
MLLNLFTLLTLVFSVWGFATVLLFNSKTGFAGVGTNAIPAALQPYVETYDLNWVIDVTAPYDDSVIWSATTTEGFRILIFLLCALTVFGLIEELEEKRILVFLVMMEVILVLLSVSLLLLGLTAGFNTSAYYNTALCILAAGGADTALALAIFMTYFKVSGLTTLK